MGPVLPRVESGDAFEARGRGPRCASERVRGRDAAAGGAPPTKAAGPAAAGPSRGRRRAGRPQISRLAAGAASREAQKGCQPPLPSGACVGQRGRGIRDGCGPFSRGIAGSRSAPHAPPSCDGATATAAPPRLPPRGCRNRCPEPPFATSARNGGAADAPPTGKYHWKGGGERKRRKMSSSSRSSLKLRSAPGAAGVRQSGFSSLDAKIWSRVSLLAPPSCRSGPCLLSSRDESSPSSSAVILSASNGPNDCLAISHLASRGRVTPSLVPRVGA